MKLLRRYLPILTWRSKYNGKRADNDVIGGTA